MDTKNRFHTDSTYLLMRLEHLAIVLIGSVLTLYHYKEVAWGRFILAFIIIDLIGYIPGAIAYRRQNGKISPVYYYLYNIAHSYLVAGVAVGLWAWAAGGFEWAMMAFPIHLSGDRGIFGNVFKPLALSFEPVAALSSPLPGSAAAGQASAGGEAA